MGIAEVIPGISGGTVALILGVYERLIKAISSFDYELIHLLLERKLNLAWSRINGNFISIYIAIIDLFKTKIIYDNQIIIINFLVDVNANIL